MKNNILSFNNNNNFSLDYSSVNQISKDLLFNTSILLKFNPEAIVTIINNYYTEENKITLLRNDNFIESIPDYALEMIINSMFFNSVFNMLQNKDIYDKISNIDANINPKDYFLIPGYLDSANLVNKSSHLMIFNLLNALNKEQIKKYLNQKYIYNKLSDFEIITLASSQNINIIDLLITRQTNDFDLENYINKMWQHKIDYSLVNNNYVKKHLLKLNDEQISKIDFKDVIYLFDYLNMHSIISIQESPITLNTFKSVIAFYSTLGIKDALAFAEEGNKKITLDEIKNLGKDLINYQLYQFKINNANTFDNITGKVINELNNINQYHGLNELINDSPYLRSIISLSNIYNYGDAITFFNDYLKYEQYYGDETKVRLYKFLNGLINNIYLNQKKLMQENFNDEILKHYHLKSTILYNKRKKYSQEFITNLKIKVMLSTISSEENTIYQRFYKEKYKVNNIEELFNKGLEQYNISPRIAINSILIPICNNNFSYKNVFQNLNIKVPDQFNLIIDENKEQKLIYQINKELKKILKNLNNNDKNEVLNYICYSTPLKSNNVTWKHIHDKIQYLNGTVFVNKDFTIGYQNNLLLKNVEDFKNIKLTIQNIDDVISYLKTFVNKVINTEEISNTFKNEIDNYLKTKSFNFKLCNHNYEASKNILCLKNIEEAFKCYNLNCNISQNYNFKEIFIKNNYLKYAALGYFRKYFPNFGEIISNYQKLDIQTSKDFFTIYDEMQKQKVDSHPLYKSLKNNTKQNLALSISDSLKLYEEIQKKDYSTIPQIKGCINNVLFETCDFHNDDLLTKAYPEILKNNILHKYICTNSNGYYINFKDVISNKPIGNLCLIRNGNVVYLNKLNITEPNINIDELLNKIANNLIEHTKNEKETIDFVIFNTYNDYCLTNNIKVNSQIINNLANPIIDNNNIDIYNDANCLLLASNKELSKTNIKNYIPKSKYFRNRNNYKIISNLAPDNEIDEINKIFYLGTPNHNLFVPINITKYKEIIYGDDWIIAKNFNNDLETFSMGNDTRCQNEMAYFLSKSKKKTKTMKIA